MLSPLDVTLSSNDVTDADLSLAEALSVAETFINVSIKHVQVTGEDGVHTG